MFLPGRTDCVSFASFLALSISRPFRGKPPFFVIRVYAHGVVFCSLPASGIYKGGRRVFQLSQMQSFLLAITPFQYKFLPQNRVTVRSVVFV